MTHRTLLAALALSAGAAPALALPVVGRPAPAFATRDANGKPVDLAALKGRTVVLEWTNQGCPYVRHAYDSGVMQDLQRHAARDGVVWISVVSSAPGRQGYMQPAEVKGWRARTGAAPAEVVLDQAGALGREYGARTTPQMFVVDPSGKLAYAGAFDDHESTDPADAKRARNYVRLALADLKAGRPVSVAATKSYGCSVKY